MLTHRRPKISTDFTCIRKIAGGWGSALDRAGGAHDAPPDPQVGPPTACTCGACILGLRCPNYGHLTLHVVKFVQLCHHQSSSIILSVGAPQGSVMGSLSFATYCSAVGDVIVTPRPHQQQCRSNRKHSTLSKLRSTLSKQHSTLLPQTATMSNDFIVKQSRNKLNMFNLFRLCRKDEISFDIVAKTAILGRRSPPSIVNLLHFTFYIHSVKRPRAVFFHHKVIFH